MADAPIIFFGYNPFNIFVYADMNSRLQRCRQKAPEGERFAYAQMKGKILDIDKNRAEYYKFLTGQKWGAKENYTFCINTSNAVIKDIALAVSNLLQAVLYCNENGK